LLRGEWPAACERCRQTEEAGAKSIRLHLNARFDRGRGEDLLLRTHRDGFLDRPVVLYADIRLGNVCNLTCRMCGPVASRLWAAHFNQVQPKSYRMPVRELRQLGTHNWVKSDSLSWVVDQSVGSVQAMHFAGGEPLIVPEMAEALELVVRSGRAGEIELSYNTNLTVLPDKVTSLWPDFKSVSLLCSVDGFGRVNDYIRRPSRWEDEPQSETARSSFRRLEYSLAAISSTIQIYNVLTIRD
jgi:sulfatase maturation enzyme AslB (radical SAM superfamily)